jgi:hypothetical protein
LEQIEIPQVGVVVKALEFVLFYTTNSKAFAVSLSLSRPSLVDPSKPSLRPNSNELGLFFGVNRTQQ